MHDNEASVMITTRVVFCILAIVSIITVGCNANYYICYQHESNMADMGYIQVVETIPGVEHAQRRWVKVSE